jgi:hypothetical protein
MHRELRFNRCGGVSQPCTHQVRNACAIRQGTKGGSAADCSITPLRNNAKDGTAAHQEHAKWATVGGGLDMRGGRGAAELTTGVSLLCSYRDQAMYSRAHLQQGCLSTRWRLPPTCQRSPPAPPVWRKPTLHYFWCALCQGARNLGSHQAQQCRGPAHRCSSPACPFLRQCAVQRPRFLPAVPIVQEGFASATQGSEYGEGQADARPEAMPRMHATKSIAREPRAVAVIAASYLHISRCLQETGVARRRSGFSFSASSDACVCRPPDVTRTHVCLKRPVVRRVSLVAVV